MSCQIFNSIYKDIEIFEFICYNAIKFQQLNIPYGANEN
jgi:hypothetical protein